MSITKNNTYYRFQAYSSGEYLNIYTDGAVKNNTTVTTFKLNSSDNCQIWKSVEYSAYGLSGTILKSRANEGFVLDRLRINDSTGKKNDADVYTLATTATDLKDQLVAIESATQGYCKIKLVHENLYLTVTDEAKKAGGYNVRWLAPTGGVNQLWLAQECTSKYTGILERSKTLPSTIGNSPYIINNIPDNQQSSGFDTNVEFHPGCGFANGTNFNNSSDGTKVKNILQEYIKKVFGSGAVLTDAQTCYYLYGERFANGSGNDFHSGVDVNYYDGAPIYALYGGEIKYAGGSYGTVSVYNSTLGVNINYLHMKNICVKVGDIINAGDKIGYESNVSAYKISPHLHFEVRPAGQNGPAGLTKNTNSTLTTIMPYGYMDGKL